MKYLNSNETEVKLIYLVKTCKSVLIFSPYINFVPFFNCCNPEIKILILSNFSKENFINGSSNIKIFEKLIKQGVGLKHNKDLHTKLYLFDNGLILGSSNLTYSGMRKNIENNIFVENSEALYDEIKTKSLELYKTQQIISETSIRKISSHLKDLNINEVIKKSYLNGLETIAQQRIITQFNTNPEEINKSLSQCTIKHGNFFYLKYQIDKELKASNFRYVSLDSYRRLCKWIHPKSSESKYIVAQGSAERISLNLFGYIIPNQIKSINLRNLLYINISEKQQVIAFHEGMLEFT